eukprot:5803209-Pleurochrysis_carterae.AAC.2
MHCGSPDARFSTELLVVRKRDASVSGFNMSLPFHFTLNVLIQCERCQRSTSPSRLWVHAQTWHGHTPVSVSPPSRARGGRCCSTRRAAPRSPTLASQRW